jgi:hypothetical protein
MPEPRRHPLAAVALLMSVCLLIGLISVICGPRTLGWDGLLSQLALKPRMGRQKRAGWIR